MAKFEQLFDVHIESKRNIRQTHIKSITFAGKLFKAYRISHSKLIEATKLIFNLKSKNKH